MVRRKHDIAVIFALILLALTFAFTRTEFRLKSEMPLEFFDRRSIAPERRASEEQIANAYWACAVNQIQWKYGYAYRLPDDPPSEFSVSAYNVGPAANDEAVKRRYWRKLRTTWNLSSVWNTRYTWSIVSFRQSLRSAGDWWTEMTREIISR